MELTKEEIAELRALKTLPDSDDIRWKEVIKKKLLENNKLIYLLNNKELQEAGAEADEYYGVNILPFYLIHATQSNVQNYLCYETGFREMARYNDKIKYGQIIFTILCEQKNNIEPLTFTARHDLIAHLIIDQFNWTNFFGTQIQLISDMASVVDNDYACRTLTFQAETTANIVKTRNGKTITITPEVHR